MTLRHDAMPRRHATAAYTPSSPVDIFAASHVTPPHDAVISPCLITRLLRFCCQLRFAVAAAR